MKKESELKQRLQDLEVGVRLMESGTIVEVRNTKIKMLREIDFLKDILEIR